MELDEILQCIQDEWEQFQHEEEQAILQRNMDKALTALAGKDACRRIERTVKVRWRITENATLRTLMREREERGKPHRDHSRVTHAPAAQAGSD